MRSPAPASIDAITREFHTILNARGPQGGIDPALAYPEGQVPGLLAEDRHLLARRDEAERQARAALRSLLIVVGSAAAWGRPAQAARDLMVSHERMSKGLVDAARATWVPSIPHRGPLSTDCR